MKSTKKPGDKELRVSDWLSAKGTASSPTTPTNGSAVDLAPSPAVTTITPPVNLGTHNGVHQDVPVAVAPTVQSQRPAILDSMRLVARSAPEPHRAPAPAEAPPVAAAHSPAGQSEHHPLPFDLFRLAGGLRLRRRKILMWAFAGYMLGFSFGWLRGDTYSASMTMMLRDVPTTVPIEAGHSYRPRTFDKPTLSVLLTSSALVTRMAPKFHPPIPVKQVEQYIDFRPSRGDTVELTFKGAKSSEDAIYNVNLWGQELVAFTQELQSRETTGTRVYLERQTLEEQASTAKSELTGLRAKYSDGNPLVREKLAQIQWLEDRLKEVDIEKQQVDTPAANPDALRNMTGYFSVVSPPTEDGVDSRSRWLKALIFGLAGFLGFLGLNTGIAVFREALDSTVKTSNELEYVVSFPRIQRIPQLAEHSLLSSTEISAVWTRIVGASPSEMVCFWSPVEHQQPHLVLQALLNQASKRSVPLVWVETEGATVRPPADFQSIDLTRLAQPIETGRYRLKLDIHAMSSVEADHVATVLVTIASRHRIPVWLGIPGPVQEAGAALARHAHRVKVLATLGTATREFWKIQAELLKQSVKRPAEWLAVNDVPWYRW
ncbi:MAG: hypothetical protein L0Z50_29660 [Verrucomicrobiales bacterium]|nr:hypothetical protein [Verrucomicrobiales bacterium]